MIDAARKTIKWEGLGGLYKVRTSPTHATSHNRRRVISQRPHLGANSSGGSDLLVWRH